MDKVEKLSTFMLQIGYKPLIQLKNNVGKMFISIIIIINKKILFNYKINFLYLSDFYIIRAFFIISQYHKKRQNFFKLLFENLLPVWYNIIVKN